ncbi:MAG: tetratricopeptide repeat protein [Magnetovibrionaceae bacterium]
MTNKQEDLLLREGMTLLARQPSGAGTLHQAGQRFSHVLQTSPNNAAALGGLGLVLLQTGQPARAAEALKRASDLAPQNADHPANLGLALVQMKRLGEAIKAWAETGEKPAPAICRPASISASPAWRQGPWKKPRPTFPRP